ncbi:MAG: 3-hydroxyacyl-CoA dehydrogenase family protein [Dysgonamonadaceae bacterium]|jgi:3-hydroxybutyryl-CoA dehydrogenase|nr:3-hydroxyacyl-CoA dehydrogenase family protein [Dysgonamonadaceae bacterium]MDD3356350.1 3-hydroxyacyl-CoA dehydrogenase family protein [Dysgonamonadaceae bacterium]MDD3727766.1 3-hydroxyacyl-CoA dehydrogenase family protein [Dysgonamonadaceae bacterium]MDD4245554.1 3-hydroxyacyl-CoA dehydrogenase family protein [Dysgonamonadaceae bacterium]MDD4604986.1 3-hydroxyacyl-CoA dehydrogenase family protein [Dysgonamonadaceae bacterium]
MSKLIIEPLEQFGLSLAAKATKRSLFSKIGVVGCGKEGRNIVNLTASAGLEVICMEESEERIEFVMNELSNSLETKVENWGLTQAEKRGIMNRITPTLFFEDFKGCDFVVECTRYSERGRRSTQLRKNIFKKLEEVLEPDAIIATNGSIVIISELAAELEHKERCVSLYFPISHSGANILEIVSGMYTSEEVYNRVVLFAKLINYIPHKINESNGNISLRVLTSMLNESCEILMERVSTLENIDRTFKVIYGQRFGIFRLADIVGIERIVSLMEAMFNDYGDKKYKPNPILWKLYRSNQLGIRTGKGFYLYNGDKPIGVNNAVFLD